MGQKTSFSIVLKVFYFLLAVGIGAGGVFYLSSQNRVRELQRQLEIERKNLRRARKHIANLLGEKRVAEIIVQKQELGEAGSTVLHLKFLEYGADGKALKPRFIKVTGKEVYFDAVIIMFKPDQVMKGKAASIHLFRRIFTDKTQPEKGIPLWRLESGDIPESYRSPEIPMKAQKQIWDEIRKILTDEAYRKRKGVRTIFGQAVYKKLEKNKIYTLKIQNNGALLIEEKPFPNILK